MQIFVELIQRVKSSLAGQNCGTCLEIIIRRTTRISLCWQANYYYYYAKLKRFVNLKFIGPWIILIVE